MKLVTFLAILATSEAFSLGVLSRAKSSHTAVSGNMLDDLVPHCDVVGQQGGGNLVEDHGWASVQGGGLVDWSVASDAPLPEPEVEPEGQALPQLHDVVGEKGAQVLTTKQDVMTVQGGAVMDWSDKQFMAGNAF